MAATAGGVEEDTLHNCYYPGWAAVMHTLYSFSQTSKYQFLEDGRFLSVSNYSAASGRSYELSRTQCVSVEDETEEHIKMVAVTLAGCEERYKCVRLFRRTDTIVEIQEGSPTLHAAAACAPINFDEELTMFTTLFQESLQEKLANLSPYTLYFF